MVWHKIFSKCFRCDETIPSVQNRHINVQNDTNEIDGTIDYPTYHQIPKRSDVNTNTGADMELLERRMAENENRYKEALSEIKESKHQVKSDSTSIPSLEWCDLARNSNTRVSNKHINSSSPTKSDIELREMLKNPQPPRTPTLLDYLSDLCSETDASTLRTISLNKCDTESESLDTILTSKLGPDSYSRKSKIITPKISDSREMYDVNQSVFLPINPNSNEDISQNQKATTVSKCDNISLSRKLLEKNLEKLIQEHRISGSELITQLTNEMTETQLEHLRHITDIELSSSDRNKQKRNISNSSFGNVTQNLDYFPPAHNQHNRQFPNSCTNGGYNNECFRSPAIPRKSSAQTMIQSSYNVTPEFFISRCQGREVRRRNSSRNYSTMERIRRQHQPDPVCNHYVTRNQMDKDVKAWKQKCDNLESRRRGISEERERPHRLAHRTHSYRQSKRNDRLFSTVTRDKKERRRSGNFFQFPTPKRNQGIHYYSPQLEKKCSNYSKPSTSKQHSTCKGYKPTSNVSSFYTDTYPVSTDYDYCSSCSSTSSSSSSDEDDLDSRYSRRAEFQNVTRNKSSFHPMDSSQYYGGVRASYLPNDRKRAMKQKKMAEEQFKRSMANSQSMIPQSNTSDSLSHSVVLRSRDGEHRGRLQRPLSEHFVVSNGKYDGSNIPDGFSEAVYKNGHIPETESETNVRRLRRKDLKNKNCIVS